MPTEPIDPWNRLIHVVLAVFILVMPAGMLIYSLRRRASRQRDLDDLARQWGWIHLPRGESHWGDRLEGLTLCPAGSRRLVQNVLYSPQDPTLVVLDLLASDGPPRPGVGFSSQTVLCIESADRDRAKSTPAISRSNLPGLPPDHRARVEWSPGWGVYYIEDHLIRASQLGRFVEEGKRVLQ
jgi:hypothetical protein